MGIVVVSSVIAWIVKKQKEYSYLKKHGNYLLDESEGKHKRYECIFRLNDGSHVVEYFDFEDEINNYIKENEQNLLTHETIITKIRN